MNTTTQTNAATTTYTVGQRTYLLTVLCGKSQGGHGKCEKKIGCDSCENCAVHCNCGYDD